MGDFTYRTREEVDEWKTRDPISRFRSRMLADGAAEAPELDSIDAEVKALVADAQQFAQQSPWPDPATAATPVYCEWRLNRPPLAPPRPAVLLSRFAGVAPRGHANRLCFGKRLVTPVT